MGKYGFALKKTPPGIVPLLAVIGAGMGGMCYYLVHMGTNPENVFDRKNNRTPWESVQQNQTTKMYDPTGRFDGKWKREQI
ncbi:hypothetical protein HDV04_001617 [Boothiomyces sp. JEL0838]|nr:hypothetical protein HDV04_001617 [Boothiomyces sp. JEL0838]